MSERTKNNEVDLNLTAHDQAVRLMASWISAIADQVRNPVAGISAAANLIGKQMLAFRAAQTWDPEIVEEAVRLMIERLRTFDHYLTELSGFTRPVEINSTWFDLRLRWSGIEQTITKRINQPFKIHAVFPETAMVYADCERLMTVLTAVIINAVEACGSTIEPEVSIVLEPLRDESQVDGVVLKISDNGPGFSSQALIQGLVPFFTTKEAGTGLGLAMVEKYMRAHGGWTKIDNNKDCGATVTLFLPSPLITQKRS